MYINSYRRRAQRAVTIIELLVVIGVLSILLGLTSSVVQSARLSAQRMQCCNNLHQLGIALHFYHDNYNALPAGITTKNGPDSMPFLSWHARLLPFLDQEGLWAKARSAYVQTPKFTRNPPHIGNIVLPEFVCPSDFRTDGPSNFFPGQPAFTSYLGVEGTDQYKQDGLFFMDSHVRFGQITDGLSNTLMVGERPPSADERLGWWYAGVGQKGTGSGDSVLGVLEYCDGQWSGQCPHGPYSFGPGNFDNQCDAFHFWSPHGYGSHFLFADGSTHFLTYSAAPLMPALATRSGGEAVTVPN
jgi:prepilin-type N-terminal cleavage/methylation domain-containing protein